MTTTKNLHETITEELGKRTIQNIAIPAYIEDNLKHNFFEWQAQALRYFLAYNANANGFLKSPSHLMFNMATGTGKTLLMAAAILYYYKQGYRHFLFFVNQNNIIDKTENNFIDSAHNKYLFTDNIIIDDKIVPIEKVHSFSDNPLSIELKFTSIHKLYNDIHSEKENQTTLSDLQSKDIIMLADEAHHLNANTKNIIIQEKLFGEELKGSKDEKEKKGWEHTVIDLIFNKQGQKDNKNVLLEFTATIPENKQVAKKYQDKIIYKFTLKEFLQKGYTKEINLLSSTLGKEDRILQALLFQWYRHKIALKNGIANFKPVILFRSKTIEESKEDYNYFLHLINDLSSTNFVFLDTIFDTIFQSQQAQLFEMGKSRTKQVLDFKKKENISFAEIASWIKVNYSEKNTIITNSKNNKTKTEKTDNETEKLLNSLEDKDNHIRAIFTVNRLTEGWDVLNLFDIVRLYQGQNAGVSGKKTPQATIQEKQLIGRGVRYYPFACKDKEKNKRKFDGNLNNEMRILEELFYHTYDEDSRYISHLKAELRKDGYISDDKVVKTFDLKEGFKQGNFYKETKIWYNQREDNPHRQKQDLDTIKKDFAFTYTVRSLEQKEDTNVLDKNLEREHKFTQAKTKTTISKKLQEIEKHIFLKAVNIKANQDPLFKFVKLKKELNIKSIDELQSNILADFKLNIVTNTDYENVANVTNTDYENVANIEKLNAVLQCLDKIFIELKKHINPKIGGAFKAGKFKKFFGEPKTKTIEKLDKDLEQDILENEWYILDSFTGTSEEKALIDFIKNSMGNLQQQYEEIYLLRNEEQYKIYNFEDGRGFAPDFLLFLKNKASKENVPLYYQIFIEPKGDQFKDADGNFINSKEGWKEDFLRQITAKYGFDNIIKRENPYYRLIGLPFFNKNRNTEFTTEFKKI